MIGLSKCDSCFDNSEIKEFHCVQCKHKADWVK
jgi:hypothetical protein